MIRGVAAFFGGMAILAILGTAEANAAPKPPPPAGQNGGQPGGSTWFSATITVHRGPPRPPGSAPGPGFDNGGFGPGPSILRDMPTPKADRGVQSPPVARYSAGQGAVFVLDRSSGMPLLKFEGSPEVWVLQASPAARGDVIYKNDMGEPILRATRLGGLTLFSNTAPGGEAVAFVGDADDLQPPPFLSPQAVFQRMLQASTRASHAAQHVIAFDATDVTPDSAPVFVDAATAASEAVIVLSHREDGKAFLRRLDKMIFQAGAQPGVNILSAEGGHARMQIFVDAAKGLAGRPSSERLVRAALGK